MITARALKKALRLKRFELKAWIGYLIGYDSTNVYRIWNRVENKVIRSRDVMFDELTVFDRNIETLRDQIRNLDLDKLFKLFKAAIIPSLGSRDT